MAVKGYEYVLLLIPFIAGYFVLLELLPLSWTHPKDDLHHTPTTKCSAACNSPSSKATAMNVEDRLWHVDRNGHDDETSHSQQQARQVVVLISGGAGFIGRHFAHRLCTCGWHVAIVDSLVSESSLHPNDWPLHLRCPPGTLSFRRQDVRSFYASEVSQRPWNLFIHLAAVIGGRDKISGSPFQVAENMAIDVATFQWLTDTSRKPQPGKTVYFSSSAAYPVKHQYKDSGILLTESMLQVDNPNQDLGFPDSTYGWGKMTGEYLAQVAHQQFGLKVVIYRPTSAYGEDQQDIYPFQAILKRVRNREDPVRLWSNSVRDSLYVGDIVECVLDSMSTVEDASAINLASGVGTPFAELVQLMAKQAGYEPAVVYLQDKPGAVAFRVGNTTNMRNRGCTMYVDLEQGIDMALRYANGEALPSMGALVEEYHCRQNKQKNGGAAGLEKPWMVDDVSGLS